MAVDPSVTERVLVPDSSSRLDRETCGQFCNDMAWAVGLEAEAGWEYERRSEETNVLALACAATMPRVLRSTPTPHAAASRQVVPRV